MADLDDDFDLDEDLDLDGEVEGEATNQPEFGVEDEDLDEDDLDDEDLEDADLTPEEVLRRAMADELDEEEEKQQ